MLAEVHARDRGGRRRGCARCARGLRARERGAGGASPAARGRLLDLSTVMPCPSCPRSRASGGGSRRRSRRRSARVEIADARLTRPSSRSSRGELTGSAWLDRRGKYLIVRFESGRALLVHLRMTGSFLLDLGGGRFSSSGGCQLDDGSALAYRDVRRFGTWLCSSRARWRRTSTRASAVSRSPMRRASHLAESLGGRRAPVKAALLDQRTVAGVGNIYADEALWRARIDPLPPRRARPGRGGGAAPGLRAALRAGSGGRARRCATIGSRRRAGRRRARVQGVRPRW